MRTLSPEESTPGCASPARDTSIAALLKSPDPNFVCLSLDFFSELQTSPPPPLPQLRPD